MGKSTILNCIDPELGLKVADVSKSTKKGIHSTTFYEMHQVSKDTFIIDSPGIRELGLYDFEAFEVGLFFPEIKALAPSCKYTNCLHLHEPDCAVLAAVEEGLVASAISCERGGLGVAVAKSAMAGMLGCTLAVAFAGETAAV